MICKTRLTRYQIANLSCSKRIWVHGSNKTFFKEHLCKVTILLNKQNAFENNILTLLSRIFYDCVTIDEQQVVYFNRIRTTNVHIFQTWLNFWTFSGLDLALLQHWFTLCFCSPRSSFELGRSFSFISSVCSRHFISCCHWLANGFKNTRYFEHAFVFSRVLSLL